MVLQLTIKFLFNSWIDSLILSMGKIFNNVTTPNGIVFISKPFLLAVNKVT